MCIIRNYRYNDETNVIDLWNNCLTRDPIDQNIFHKKVILDENFNNELCLVAEDNNRIVGFILGMSRKYPYEERGTEPEKGWISVVFVDKDYRFNGIGKKLVEEIEKRFINMGKRNITLASYSPNYFFPGPDKDVYSDSIEFFKKLGYQELGEAVGMDMILYDFKIPDEVKEIEKNLNEKGYRIETFKKIYSLPLLQFLQKHFPGGWVRNARNALIKNKAEDTLLLAFDKNNDIVGYCQRAIDDIEGHFGPFGVDENLRGQKIGTVLFYKMLFDMYKRGIYHVWLAWTDGDAQRFYERAGMKVNKKHAIMKKILNRKGDVANE
ncbi:GNAT family N-acetyltransferase [Thermoanaerobacterium thermosaccharolyticum]|uniref:GNAT family N-acetyltransferase n=1 Tax=Thermoanaerobacterium thermosaccharolyticum TaxID=1517 RepID=UPI0020A3388A|nr:GNAT family N-acetyltransferase [Thermoanaerobacterium thermosaccharolyticum]MCP2241172.1 ribosomal protein S18 acetylase RimI-like enzyme [Thermoanaerobacterium thermosaccharolyticum]